MRRGPKQSPPQNHKQPQTEWRAKRAIARAASTLCILLTLPAFAAPSKRTTPAMPTQPLALLQLGARHNGLTAPNLPPWHIQVSYQTYKLDGRRQSTGIFEEWWAAPNQYRLSFRRKGYQLQAWVTPHGSFAIGNPNLPMPERLVYHWMVAPIPQHPDLTGATLWYRVRLIGSLHFPCVQINARKAAPGHLPPVYPIYCFQPKRPMLRIARTHVSEDVLYTTIGLLRSQYIPQSFQLTLGHMPILSAKLLHGESYLRLAPSLFAPPANATPAPPPSTAILYLTAAEAATHLIPFGFRDSSAWKDLHQNQAFIPLAVSIGVHGRVHNVHLLTPTPPSLVADAYHLVSNFRYRPFRLHGRPAAVRTRIVLDFRTPLPK